uniref:TIR domain-containing protein n=1 Tax=Fagus sylvatica TaxID=28930 RepID=A0A2N9GNS1_FAGSY
MASSSSSSSSTSKTRWKYDVFLSFRGEDTRHGFTDHLYKALRRENIHVFRGDEQLQQSVIDFELMKAIEESQYAIIVFSENYADSKWCLDELAEIVQFRKKTGITVLPVFHHVDQSHVRNQTGPFAIAFGKHEKDDKINVEKMQKWKDALREVANLPGWDLNQRPELIVNQNIVGSIHSELYGEFLSGSKDLVGIESSVEEMMDLLNAGLNDVRFIGIWGKGGVGKSTLAEVIFCKIWSHEWFGPGSRIIITSRDKQLLTIHEVDDMYEAKRLDNDKALELFSQRAFKQSHPKKDFVNMCNDFVKYAKGLPLALEVFGSFLFHKEIDDKSLITIFGGKLWTHDLLQEMGREIVHREAPQEPGLRSRLWHHKDIFSVLKTNTGTKNVEGMMLNSPPHKHKKDLDAKTFSEMTRLRLFKICNVLLPQGLNYLSNELRMMEWHDYPLKSMPRGFRPNNLVEFIMPHSHIEQLPKGFSDVGVNHQKPSHLLRLLPILSSIGVPISFKGIFSLLILSFLVLPYNYTSIFICATLVLGKYCIFNSRHPEPEPINLLLPKLYSGLSSLKSLDLSNCNLSDGALPDDLSCLSSLQSLKLSKNNFTHLPDSFSQLSKLKLLYLDNCSKLRSLPCLPLRFTLINCLRLVEDEEGKITDVVLLDSLLEDEGGKITEGTLLDMHFRPLWQRYMEVSPGPDVKYFHEFICLLDMDGGTIDCPLVYKVPRDKIYVGSFGLWLYISHARFRELLNECDCIRPLIRTNSPDVEIKGCGARILYEPDVVEFVQHFSQKIFRSPDDEVESSQSNAQIDPEPRLKSEVESSQSNAQIDLDPRLKSDLKSLLSRLEMGHDTALSDYIFPQIAIPQGWFSYQNLESYIKMELPPNLLDNSTWMGFTIFAFYTVDKQRAGSSYKQDSTIFLSFCSLPVVDEVPLTPYIAVSF